MSYTLPFLFVSFFHNPQFVEPGPPQTFTSGSPCKWPTSWHPPRFVTLVVGWVVSTWHLPGALELWKKLQLGGKFRRCQNTRHLWQRLENGQSSFNWISNLRLKNTYRSKENVSTSGCWTLQGTSQTISDGVPSRKRFFLGQRTYVTASV